MKYVQGPVRIAVSVPSGYREQLEILSETLGEKRAPYFGPDLEYPRESRSIWEGHRGIEAYAKEVFPIEEHNNGARWLEESDAETPSEADGEEDESDPRGSRPMTPATQPMSAQFSGAYTPRSHPEGLDDNFFVGST